jgi:hypothetical protein
MGEGGDGPTAKEIPSLLLSNVRERKNRRRLSVVCFGRQVGTQLARERFTVHDALHVLQITPSTGTLSGYVGWSIGVKGTFPENSLHANESLSVAFLAFGILFGRV